MSFNHLKQCTGCGKKIRPTDTQRTCDICGSVFCAECIHTRMVVIQGKGSFTNLVCQKCADLNRSKVVGPNQTMCN